MIIDKQKQKKDGQKSGACAKVVIKIEQELVLTRTGFLATLEIQNDGDSPLENIRVTLTVTDTFDNVRNDLFAIGNPELQQITSVNGGTLAGQFIKKKKKRKKID